MKTLCAKAMEILMEESNVQRVDAPVTVRTKRRLAMGDSEGRRAQVALGCAACVAERVVLRAMRVVARYTGARRLND